MWTAIVGLGGVLVGILLEAMLLPHLEPMLSPVLPAISEAIQSTMARQNEAAFTTAIRYTAAGYREPGDVLLTFMDLVVWCGLVVWGLSRLPPSSQLPAVAWKRRAVTALVVLGVLVAGYVVYLMVTELDARTAAMRMYKLYERKMAALAPYISPQEARELGSQWARMQTRADLQAMDERFLTLLRQHGIVPGGPPAATPSEP